LGYEGGTDRYFNRLEETTLVILGSSGEGLGHTVDIIYITIQCLYISPQDPSGDSYHAGNTDQNALDENHCVWWSNLKMK
jgi:hypothetical protein